ncbi:MAG: hypothetical protein ACYCWE_11025 [Eubacteriales bacterium]
MLTLKSAIKNITAFALCIVMLFGSMSCGTGDIKETENIKTEENILTTAEYKNEKVNHYPKYISVHKIDQPGKNQWYVSDPSSVNQASFDEITGAIGTAGNNDRRLAIAYTFEYANFKIDDVAECIKNILRLAEKNDVAVILHLDGVNYWGYYPELWNFWDENAKGYNPLNYKNVERYGWEEDTAVKIGWRNWGAQFRVAPAPNLAAPAFLELQKNCLAELFPIIADWYDALPDDKKYLLGGVVLGWELTTYVQSYYYLGGNELLGKPASQDPVGGLTESMPLGYAAALELGLQNEGVITAETEDKICSFYMEYLIELALEYGIAPDRIITHSFYGGETKNGGGQTGAASISKHITDGVVPGWSFYGDSIYEMEKVIDLADGYNWAAIEFKPWGLTYRLLNQVLNYKGCRYINIYNWNAIRDNTEYHKIIADIINSK